MFNDLQDKLDKVFKKLRGEGRLTEANISESLREVRRALLEADVNFKLVKNFIAEVEKRAVGTEVLTSLKPGQQVIKIVHEQLVHLMGETTFSIKMPNNRLNRIMLVGLQGSGKTTTCGKLANYWRKRGLDPILVACDIYRPAAVQQLETLGRQLNIPVVKGDGKDVISIAREALKVADTQNKSLIIFDTAGRLHVDEAMMDEVERLQNFVNPDHVFFVADAMTGQDAINSAREFNSRLEISGVILTKLDGDSRGGAALSIRAVTEKPIAYIGLGEKTSDLEEFHPARMADRILGMGDVLTLIEKAQDAVDEKEAEKLAERLRKNQFTFSDFLKQLHQVRKMGPLEKLLELIPGVNKSMLKEVNFDGKELNQVEAIILSMTTKEREHPDIINGSRRARIAKGSGTSVQQVNRLLKQFEDMKKMIKRFNDPKMRGKFQMPQ